MRGSHERSFRLFHPDRSRHRRRTRRRPRARGAARPDGRERCRRLDLCVNNAAVAPHATLLDERVEVWDTVYAVNCRGTFLMTQAAAKAMIAGGKGGRII